MTATEPPVHPQLEQVDARLRAVESDLEEVLRTVADAASTLAEAPGGVEGVEEFDLGVLDAWVRDWFLPTFPRRAGRGARLWCEQWWAHTEAVLRLEAMRRSFAGLQAQGPTGLGVWFRDYLDPGLAALLDPAGPFSWCEGGHVEPRPLTSQPVPADLLSPEPSDGVTRGSGQPV